MYVKVDHRLVWETKFKRPKYNQVRQNCSKMSHFITSHTHVCAHVHTHTHTKPLNPQSCVQTYCCISFFPPSLTSWLNHLFSFCIYKSSPISAVFVFLKNTYSYFYYFIHLFSQLSVQIKCWHWDLTRGCIKITVKLFYGRGPQPNKSLYILSFYSIQNNTISKGRTVFCGVKARVSVLK